MIPNLPIYQNTFFPPNQPPARRSYDFGLQVGEAIRSWDSDMKVVVFGSGGMSHFCIDEAWDKKFMDAMISGDIAYLKSIPLDELQAGQFGNEDLDLVGRSDGANEHGFPRNRLCALLPLAGWKPARRKASTTGRPLHEVDDPQTWQA